MVKCLIDYKEASRKEPNPKPGSPTPDSEQMFLSYLGDYYAGLNNIDEKVRNSIIHEMIVHESEKIIEEEPELKFPEAREYLYKKAKVRVRNKINSKISEEEWMEIWKNVDLSA